ncbi:hypothetical protein NicSoilB8_25640 [Arthrobacter sp. NicSoilB8]|nr:hypothetical protein NicSoilB8_25640 [Arthrobacter sp. NicSoilB8]
MAGVAICPDHAETSVKLLSGKGVPPAEAPWVQMTDAALLAHLPEIAAVAS